MSTESPEGERILGTLRAVEGRGILRLEDRLPATADDLWSALTEPARLAGWLGGVEGDLRVGGEFRASYFASGWEGTGRVEACEPTRLLRVLTRSADGPDVVVEATLAADRDGAGTVVVLEFSGLPLAHIAAYGAGDQIHLEDLASYLAGGGPCDARTRWEQLHPGYGRLAAGLT